MFVGSKVNQRIGRIEFWHELSDFGHELWWRARKALVTKEQWFMPLREQLNAFRVEEAIKKHILATR